MKKSTKALFAILMLVTLFSSMVFGDKVKLEASHIALFILLFALLIIDKVKKFKIGDNEVELSAEEIKEVEKAEKEIGGQTKRPEIFTALQNIYAEDKRLAFAKIRMILEEKIDLLTELKGNPSIITKINNCNGLSGQIRHSLVTIVRYCNQLIHGADFDSAQADKIFSLSISIIVHLSAVVESLPVPIDINKYHLD